MILLAFQKNQKSTTRTIERLRLKETRNVTVHFCGQWVLA